MKALTFSEDTTFFLLPAKPTQKSGYSILILLKTAEAGPSLFHEGHFPGDNLSSGLQSIDIHAGRQRRGVKIDSVTAPGEHRR